MSRRLRDALTGAIPASILTALLFTAGPLAAASPGPIVLQPGEQVTIIAALPTSAPTSTPTSTPTPAPSTTPTAAPTATPRPTPTATVAPTPTPTSTPMPPASAACDGLHGIELRFPCSPLSAGPLPAHPGSGPDAWDQFTRSLYGGANPFSAVPNPAGEGVVVRDVNDLTLSEGHTTLGTGRDLPKGSTSCSAFRWLWATPAEFDQRGWVLVWQLQMKGSPIVALSVDRSSGDWFYKSRNGSDSGLDVHLGRVQFGHWAYVVACTTLSDTAGHTAVWFAHDAWPDVAGRPAFERSGYDSWQGETGHNTLGIYAQRAKSGAYVGYFDRYGRAATPERAVELAGGA